MADASRDTTQNKISNLITPSLLSHVIKGTKYVSLADYCAMGNSEVSMKEGSTVELKKIGCAGWWYVRVLGKCSILTQLIDTSLCLLQKNCLNI